MPSTLARLARPLIAIGALLVAAVAAPTVVADGDAFGIIVTPPIVEPGGEITIQGGALWSELQISAELVDPDGAARPLGATMTAADGSLFWVVPMPVDVPDGRYEVIVSNAAGETVQAYVIVRSAVPVIPIVAGLVAAVAIGLVLWSGVRRRRAADGAAGPG